MVTGLTSLPWCPVASSQNGRSPWQWDSEGKNLFRSCGFYFPDSLGSFTMSGEKSLDNKLKGSLGQEEEEDKKLIFNVLAPS